MTGSTEIVPTCLVPTLWDSCDVNYHSDEVTQKWPCVWTKFWGQSVLFIIPDKKACCWDETTYCKHGEEYWSFLRWHALGHGRIHASDSHQRDEGCESIPPHDEGTASIFKWDEWVAAAQEQNGNSPIVKTAHYIWNVLVFHIAEMTSSWATETEHGSQQISNQWPLGYNFSCIKVRLEIICIFVLMQVKVFRHHCKEYFQISALTLNVSKVPALIDRLFGQLLCHRHQLSASGWHGNVNTELIHGHVDKSDERH